MYSVTRAVSGHIDRRKLHTIGILRCFTARIRIGKMIFLNDLVTDDITFRPCLTRFKSGPYLLRIQINEFRLIDNGILLLTDLGRRLCIVIDRLMPVLPFFRNKLIDPARGACLYRTVVQLGDFGLCRIRIF